METLLANAGQAGLLFWVFFIPLFLLIWFLPSLVAAFFNRGQLKYIAAANIPAGMSLIAWGALLVWAAGGRYSEKYLAKFKRQPQDQR